MLAQLPVNTTNLRECAYQCLLDLITEEGINASSKDEVFGCIFGRDSAIVILKILNVYRRNPDLSLLAACKKTLLTLVNLQGKEFNLENGEQPGKFIHEFRRDKYEHLLKTAKPWFIGPDGFLRNYDSVDSTPLTLIALYKYWQVSKDQEFLITILPAVEAGLNWLITFGDLDKDLLIEYEFSSSRRSGGLTVQSWTDSSESLLQPGGQMPKYPIAPVEVQSYAWLAMSLWGSFYLEHYPVFGKKLLSQAKSLKKRFNEMFILQDKGYYFAAQVLDGDKNQIKTITANPLLCLWAALDQNGQIESILDKEIVPDFVNRAFEPDMFVEEAGIRTMSASSHAFNPRQDSYHNGSFWPVLNGLVIEGLNNFGFSDAAAKLKQASLVPLMHFGYPIELYIKNNDSYLEYRSPFGQVGCHFQAWSAAAVLDILT